MKTKKKRDRNWTKMLQDHSMVCEAVKRGLEELDRRLEDGDDVTDALDQLKNLVLRMHRGADLLAKVLHRLPVAKAFSADRLNITEQQYWLLCAVGFNGFFTARSLGVSPISDYEAYQLCVYEDDKVVAFLDPDETPPPPPRRNGRKKTIAVHLALSPEEVDPAYLRPEQIDFFKKYRPDVLPRLGKLKREGRDQASAQPVARKQGDHE